jgi:restriction system protein
MVKFEKMTWREFEFYVGNLYKRLGYRTQVTEAQGDGGVDVKLFKDGKRYVVQTKHYSEGHFVGRPEVQQFVGVVQGYDGGMFVTTSDFTDEALAYAQAFNYIELVNGTRLLELIDESGMY